MNISARIHYRLKVIFGQLANDLLLLFTIVNDRSFDSARYYYCACRWSVSWFRLVIVTSFATEQSTKRLRGTVEPAWLLAKLPEDSSITFVILGYVMPF